MALHFYEFATPYKLTPCVVLLLHLLLSLFPSFVTLSHSFILLHFVSCLLHSIAYLSSFNHSWSVFQIIASEKKKYESQIETIFFNLHRLCSFTLVEPFGWGIPWRGVGWEAGLWPWVPFPRLQKSMVALKKTYPICKSTGLPGLFDWKHSLLILFNNVNLCRFEPA